MVVRSLQIALHSATSARDFVPTPRTRVPGFRKQGAGLVFARSTVLLWHAAALVLIFTHCRSCAAAQHATDSMQRAMCNMQCATRNVQRMAYSMEGVLW